MPDPKVATGAPIEDTRPRVGAPAVSSESTHPQPADQSEVSAGDAPALIQIGPTDI